ncbi:hypothetical protein PH7735_00799 [Shimia thalassica]|uniref:Uncharacterized protein n=1 Tax=Shimia thalassica TaxID=1715693 RepID=A0A0P1I393_9RHOB|nr:hypothetical protein PH7735_00799 [Shimia thalassica]
MQYLYIQNNGTIVFGMCGNHFRLRADLRWCRDFCWLRFNLNVRSFGTTSNPTHLRRMTSYRQKCTKSTVSVSKFATPYLMMVAGMLPNTIRVSDTKGDADSMDVRSIFARRSRQAEHQQIRTMEYNRLEDQRTKIVAYINSLIWREAQ